MTPQQIIAMVAEAHNVTAEQVIGKRRPHKFVVPRWKAMWLCRRLVLGATLEQIGEWFGSRDHGTVMNALKNIPNWPAKELDDLMQLERIIGGASSIPTDWKKAMGKKVLVMERFKVRQAKVRALSKTGNYVKLNDDWTPVARVRIVDVI